MVKVVVVQVVVIEEVVVCSNVYCNKVCDYQNTATSSSSSSVSHQQSYSITHLHYKQCLNKKKTSYSLNS